MSTLPLEIRQILVKEINSWVQQNLLNEAQAYVIRAQYNFDFPRYEPNFVRQPLPPHTESESKAAPAPATPPAQPASVMQTLLGETSIKIALYLGAFFVIAAALILAALTESLRLPTLTAVAIGVGISAVALKNRMPQPSFILWVVFTAFVPIIASVMGDYLKLTDEYSFLYWAAVSGGMFIIWSISTWYYRSRIFSLSTFAALGIAAAMICQFFKTTGEFYFLALVIAGCCGLIGVWLLKRWQNVQFAMPLFVTLNLLIIFVLAFSFIYSIYHFLNLPGLTTSETMWPITTLIWVIAALFFIAADTLISFAGFPLLAIASLLLLPWFILAPLHPQNSLYALSWWAWGLIFTVISEVLRLSSSDKVRQYMLPLTWGGIALLTLGAVIGMIYDLTFGFILFFVSAILLTGLHILQPRWWAWTAAITFGIIAYFLFFQLPQLRAIASDFIYQLTGLVALLLLPDLLLKPDLNAHKIWRWPLRIYGALFVAYTTIICIIFGLYNLPFQTLIAYGVFALLGLIYSLRYRSAEIGYAFTGYLALSAIFMLRYLGAAYWLWPLVVLSIAYYVTGWLIKQLQFEWGTTLEFSGLGFGSLVALFAWAEGSGLGACIPVALIATLWTIEAFRRRNTWLGFPANGLYLLSYYLLLLAIKIDEPQFFSVGAALLGILMHYLLVRSGSKEGAFFTGMFSQVILLGTTYIQMVGTQNLNFFAALFFQSLIIMLYGIVIRSRSLTFAPIGFVVLGVATAVLSIKGVSTVLLVGCTGIVMILLAILAIFMRGSIIKVGKHISDWIA